MGKAANDDTMEDFGPVTVGDLNSEERGSGARRNGGKPQWFQFPFWSVIPAMNYYRTHRGLWDAQQNLSQHDRVMNIIGLMSDWQRGGPPHLLDQALAETLYVLEADLDWEHPGTPSAPFRSLVCMVRVLEFGAIKYKIGNWAKGMPWNTAFTCTMSHLLKYLAGQIDDEESTQHTLAHAAVNLAFLIGFKTLYPEGDDRIKEFRQTENQPIGALGPRRCTYRLGGEWRCTKQSGHEDGHYSPIADRLTSRPPPDQVHP